MLIVNCLSGSGISSPLDSILAFFAIPGFIGLVWLAIWFIFIYKKTTYLQVNTNSIYTERDILGLEIRRSGPAISPFFDTTEKAIHKDDLF